MDPLILFRPPDRLDLSEMKTAEKYFDVVEQRSLICEDDIVIGRYSVLPYYSELETDVKAMGGKLVNTFQEHQFVADLRNYTEVLGELTPRTWYRLEDVPENAAHSFIVKGETNSRKDRFNTHMFAATKQDAIQVASRLQEDSLLSTQQLYVREYVPLESVGTGINGMPISLEFRIFVLYGNPVAAGYYWANHLDKFNSVPSFDMVDMNVICSAIDRIGERVKFYAMDVAKTQDGRWIVIELNDGQMSGLSTIDPDDFYKSLRAEF